MLIPRFSIRWMLGIMLLAALVSLAAGWARQGNGWAIAFTAAVLCLAIVVLLHASLFLLCWPLSAALQMLFRQPPAPPTSGPRSLHRPPEHRPPEQILSVQSLPEPQGNVSPGPASTAVSPPVPAPEGT